AARHRRRGREDIRVGRSEDDSCPRTGRGAGDVNLVRVRVVLQYHLSGYTSQQGRLSAVAVLVPRIGRVPAVDEAAEHPLRRVSDDEAFTVGQAVELSRS